MKTAEHKKTRPFRLEHDKPQYDTYRDAKVFSLPPTGRSRFRPEAAEACVTTL